MRSDYTTIGLFDCKIYVSGITNVGFKKEFSKIINECKIVNIKPETMQKNLLIKVAEKKLESVKFAIKLNDNNE